MLTLQRSNNQLVMSMKTTAYVKTGPIYDNDYRTALRPDDDDDDSDLEDDEEDDSDLEDDEDNIDE